MVSYDSSNQRGVGLTTSERRTEVRRHAFACERLCNSSKAQSRTSGPTIVSSSRDGSCFYFTPPLLITSNPFKKQKR